MEIHGKVCIITGSAQGLGKAFAVKLLEAGANICLSDINQVLKNLPQIIYLIRYRFISNF